MEPTPSLRYTCAQTRVTRCPPARSSRRNSHERATAPTGVDRVVGRRAPSATGNDPDTDGTIVPVLAAEAPSIANGGVARDGMSVVWRLKRGVAWHDGRPFTAADVIFTWQYAADPATAATSAGSYQGINRIERLDDYTVKIVFNRPTPYWADAFCSAAGMVLPRHVFEPFRGGRSREAAPNLRPVGTGPYRFVDFKPGDVLHAEISGGYHVPNRPFFDTVEMKGGGDPVSSARAVLLLVATTASEARATLSSGGPRTWNTSSSIRPIRGARSRVSARV